MTTKMISMPQNEIDVFKTEAQNRGVTFSKFMRLACLHFVTAHRDSKYESVIIGNIASDPDKIMATLKLIKEKFPHGHVMYCFDPDGNNVMQDKELASND